MTKNSTNKWMSRHQGGKRSLAKRQKDAKRCKKRASAASIGIFSEKPIRNLRQC
jgi:hypothetical protein